MGLSSVPRRSGRCTGLDGQRAALHRGPVAAVRPDLHLDRAAVDEAHAVRAPASPAGPGRPASPARTGRRRNAAPRRRSGRSRSASPRRPAADGRRRPPRRSPGSPRSAARRARRPRSTRRWRCPPPTTTSTRRRPRRATTARAVVSSTTVASTRPAVNQRACRRWNGSAIASSARPPVSRARIVSRTAQRSLIIRRILPHRGPTRWVARPPGTDAVRPWARPRPGTGRNRGPGRAGSMSAAGSARHSGISTRPGRTSVSPSKRPSISTPDRGGAAPARTRRTATDQGRARIRSTLARPKASAGTLSGPSCGTTRGPASTGSWRKTAL